MSGPFNADMDDGCGAALGIFFKHGWKSREAAALVDS
jgi:hypothetical protein